MSSKGLSFPAFCSGMESNATTYVICGIAAFVIWNIVSYAKNSGGSKKKQTPKRDERNGGGVVLNEVPALNGSGAAPNHMSILNGNGVVPNELSTLTPSPGPGDVKSDEQILGNGFVDRDDGSEPARDRGESEKSPPTKRDGRNGVGAVATAVSTASFSSLAGNFKSSHLGNGIAGRIKSEPGHDQDIFLELRSSEATRGSDEQTRGPEREERRRAANGPSAVVDGVDACRPSADRRQPADGGSWKGEGPHVVCLLDCGWTEEDLDVNQRPIEVYAWFDHHQSCDCSLEFAVILQDKKRRRVAEYQHCPASFKPARSVYKKVSLIFQSYGSGVRYVTYSHRRRKYTQEECKGHCVSEMYSGLRKLLKINNLK